MKYFICNVLIISCLCFSNKAFSQTEKGSWLIGGNMGASSGKSTTFTNFNANFSPEGGYFFKKNLVLGLNLPYSYSSQTVNLTNYPASTYSKYQIFTNGLSPFIRYYFGQKTLKPFVQAHYVYSYFSETTTPISGSDITNSGYSAYSTAGMGLAYFMAKNVSIDATLDYQVFRSNANYNFNNQPVFKIGFQIFLPKK